MVSGGGVFFVNASVCTGIRVEGGCTSVRTRRDVLDGGVFEDGDDGSGFLAADFDGAAGAGAVGFVLGAEVVGGLVVFVVVGGGWAEVGC